MSRSKLNKLMSRASTLALAAVAGVLGTGGAVGTAQAGDQTVTGPGNQPHVRNTSNAEFIVIENGALVGIDPVGGVNSFLNDPGIVINNTVGGPDISGTGVVVDTSILQGKFVNLGTIRGDTDGVNIFDSTLQAGISNAGLISVNGTSDDDGVEITSSNIAGGFVNSGTITGGGEGTSAHGVSIFNAAASSRTFAGGFTNSGTISADVGVYFEGKTSQLLFTGGLTNSGQILGGDGQALYVGDLVDFAGGIQNQSTGKILSSSSTGVLIESADFAGGITNAGTIAGNVTGTGTAAGLRISSLVDTFAGGITNSGVILAGVTATATTTATAHGIVVSAETVNGGIVNASTGDIVADGDGILLISDTGTFNGGVNNAGTIDSVGASGNGIEVDYETFNGGIVNSGTISASSAAILVTSDVDNFTGGISNSGLVESTDDDGIEVAADSFVGGIQNSGTVFASSTGIYVTSDVTSFTGGLVNSGLIRTTDSGNGIGIYADAFTGGLTNSGTIDADEGDGIAIGSDSGESFAGGLTNSGRMEADSVGVNVFLGSFTGGLTNTGTGIIDAGTTGIFLEADSFAGGLTNAGTILADNGIDMDVDDTFTGGVINSGFINADSGFGIQITGADTFEGGFLNSGTIVTTSGGTTSAVFANGVDIDVTAFNGGFTNTGLIDSTGGPINNGDAGVTITAETFNGGFTNSGTILADPTLFFIPSISGSEAAVVLNIETFDGGFTNSGLIDADDGMGVYFYGNTFHDGINNSGTINSTDTGVAVIASSFDGGFVNSGLIDSTQATGVRFEVSGNYAGGVNNSGTIISADDAIHMDVGVTFSGGITNSGDLDAGDDGIRTEGSSFQGGIHNLAAGTILASETGIQVTNDTFGGGIHNAGLINAETRGVDTDVETFSGGITNSGTIISGLTAVEVDGTTFSDGILNSGLVEGGEGDGFNIDVTTFNGGFRNTGTISASSTGVYLAGTTFNGGVSNSGTITGDYGLYVEVDTLNGGIHNSGTISADTTGLYVSNSTLSGGISNSGLISSGSYGVDVSTNTWTSGNFSNSGTITSVTYTAVQLDVNTFTGNITNSGTILSASYTALSLDLDAMTGSVSNSGLIQGDDYGLYMTSSAVTGSIANSGTIRTEGDGYDAVYLSSSTVSGVLTNSGLIESVDQDAIVVSGHVSSGIFNSGTILAGEDALDLSSVDSGHTFTQTAGVMVGDIEINNGYDDTLNLNGGSLSGDISGSTSDDVANVNAGSGSFAYLNGTIDGLSQLNINSGTGVFGGPAVGTNGDGVYGGEGIVDINVNGGTLYLDDDTELRANDTYDQDEDAEVQFLLSRDTDDNTFAGDIDADTANIDGTITGVVDLAAFALGAGTTNFYTYDNVIEANTLNGTFDNVGVLDDLIFFDITAEYDGDDTVDLVLERLSFSEVLAEASQSSNQQQVGAVLETIFNAGGFDPDFAEAFEDLLGSSSYDEALAVYDQLLGAEHAQAALAMFNSMGQFQGFLGERMDVLHNGMGTAQWAMFGQPGTQVAAAETVLADASPSPAVGGGSMVTTRNGNTISMFGGVSGNWSSVEGDTNGPGFDQDTFGLNAGIDYAFSSETVVGLGGSYQTSEVEFESDNSGDVDTFAVGLFGTFGLGGGYLDANANVGFHDVSMSRLTPAPDYASAEYSATSWSLSGELGTVIPVGRAYVAPMLSMTYVGVSVDSFTETGSAFALSVDGADTDSFATVLGARAGDYFKVGKATVNLQGNLGWRHEFGDEEASFTAAFLEEPALLFNVDSSKIATDSATFGVGTTVSISTRTEVFLNYDGVWNAEADSHNASLGVRASW